MSKNHSIKGGKAQRMYGYSYNTTTFTSPFLTRLIYGKSKEFGFRRIDG